MFLFKSIPFSVEKKDYEVKVFYNDTLVNILVFHNKYPANGFRRHGNLPGNHSVESLLNGEAVEEIVEEARQDTVERMWERVLEASAP